MPWNAIQYVTSGLTLTAFLAAVLLAFYRHRLRARERLIDSVPENERAALVQATLERFDVETTRLTKQQAYDLALEQLRGSSRRYMINAGLVGVFGLFTFVLFLVNWSQRSQSVVDVGAKVSVPNSKIDEYHVHYKGSNDTSEVTFTRFCVPQSAQALSFYTSINAPEAPKGPLLGRVELEPINQAYTFKFSHKNVTGSGSDTDTVGHFQLISDGRLMGRLGKADEYELIGTKSSNSPSMCQ